MTVTGYLHCYSEMLLMVFVLYDMLSNTIKNALLSIVCLQSQHIVNILFKATLMETDLRDIQNVLFFNISGGEIKIYFKTWVICKFLC